MRLFLSRLCRWSRRTIIVSATLGLGYVAAVYWPVDPVWLYPAILIGFLGCDASLWSRRPR